MNKNLDIKTLSASKEDLLRIIEASKEDLRNNKILPERVDAVKRVQIVKYTNLFNILYATKSDNSFLKEKLEELILKLPEYWVQDKVKVFHGRKRIELHQYSLDAYHQMLMIMSLAVIFDVSKDKFATIVQLIDRDNVKDFLYEHFIRYYFPDREKITEESYIKFFAIPKMNKRIVDILENDDKTTLSKNLKQYLDKYWYKTHKDFSWYDSHKKYPNAFYGYWAFEVAALVKMKDLDDSLFRDNEFYPDRLI
ncbi:uncharacterized protein DUF1910 [Kordia periserrulae]|uniref:Uncharacterized protein DUF1910 n=1 Tax=Kordia periserrulae TaxID=701523 RepID=A0A2T6BUP8_9FLAO|nr:PoNe immunity protein domain-containing protein [Kordia periserrulae]PTX59809.1 uncharacterized protein DUF1910 [Kordia periserrulae]